jgi:DNA-binding response OmpR family regulator
MRILIADDDKDQLELRSLLFSRSGYQTIAVNTARAALREAKAQRPECALVDLKFPTEAAGLRLIRALKELDAGMRVFVLTGGDPQRINALPEKTLVEEVFVKGSSTASLMQKLGELLGGRRTGVHK